MPTSEPAPVVWTLRRPGTPDATFAALGITRAVRRLKNAGVGTLELSFGALKPLFAASTMAYQTPVQVFRDGEPWFSGVVTGRSPIASGAAESSRITVSDPWRWLERTPFRQPGFFLLNPLAPTDNTAAAPTNAGTIGPTPGLVTTVQDADPASPPRVINDPTNIIYGQSLFFVPAVGLTPPPNAEFVPSTSGQAPLPITIPGAIVLSKTNPATGAKTAAIVTALPIVAPVAAAVPRTYITAVQMSSHVAVGQDDSGHLVSGADTIRAALNYCLSLFTDPPFQLGDVDPDIQVPAQEFNAQSCAEVIRSVLEWARDTTAWMDHATAPPTLHVATRADRATVALKAGDDADACVVSAALEPMPEQILSGVTLEYLRTYEQGGVTTPPYQQVDQAGFDPVGPGALVVSFGLSGAATTNADGSSTSVGEDAPAGLAQRIFDSRSFLEWRGTVTLAEDDLALRPAWPGVCVNVLGIEEAWEAARVQVQASEEDAFSNTTTLTLGPPDQLSPQNFLALARAAQRTNRVNPTTTTIRTGGPAITPPTLPTDPTAPTNGGGGGGGGNGGTPGGPLDPANLPPGEEHLGGFFIVSLDAKHGETHAVVDNNGPPQALPGPGSYSAVAGGGGQSVNRFAVDVSFYSSQYGGALTGKADVAWTANAVDAHFDGRAYPKLKYKAAYLIGTSSKATAAGNVTHAVAIDVSAYLGTTGVMTLTGDQYAGEAYNANVGGQNRGGGATFTTVRLVPR